MSIVSLPRMAACLFILVVTPVIAGAQHGPGGGHGPGPRDGDGHGPGDEAALADALGKRTIAGAALDVFDQEPLPSDSPLWGLDNLLITPHTAGLTEKLWPRHFELLSENIRRFIAGEPLLFVVDKHRGY